MYLLRWRFEYWHGTAPKCGPWGRGALSPEEYAAFQPKTGLARVLIQGKNLYTYEIETLAEVKGDDFCNVVWDACLSMYEGQTSIVGMSLLTRDEKISVSRETGALTRSLRSEEEKRINYAGY